MERRLKKVSKDAAKRGARESSSTAAVKEHRLRSKKALLALLATYERRALDESRSVRSRLEALAMLRRYGGRSGEVGRSMMKLLLEIDDPALRAQLIRNLAGVEDAEVAEGLIQTLLQDTDADVREEAAAALATFARNDDVRWALEEAYRGDVSSGVRKTARLTLVENRDAGK